ncbi:MAG: hypothetical protein ACI92E_000609 [Oceanicoccus sp.]|jgi:hypothetical protein
MVHVSSLALQFKPKSSTKKQSGGKLCSKEGGRDFLVRVLLDEITGYWS